MQNVDRSLISNRSEYIALLLISKSHKLTQIIIFTIVDFKIIKIFIILYRNPLIVIN